MRFPWRSGISATVVGFSISLPSVAVSQEPESTPPVIAEEVASPEVVEQEVEVSPEDTASETATGHHDVAFHSTASQPGVAMVDVPQHRDADRKRPIVGGNVATRDCDLKLFWLLLP